MMQMIRDKQIAALLAWQEKFGGSNIRPAGHALKLLGEAVELAIACGADRIEIDDVITTELLKAYDRREFTCTFSHAKASEEVADVLALLTILAQNNRIDASMAVDVKLPILHQRLWEADKDGVLRRPRRTMS